MKVEQNIYYDERCTKFPYSVNVMRSGKSFAKKCTTIEEARELRDEFIKQNSIIETEDENVYIRNGQYALIFSIDRTYQDYETAVKNAKILRKFSRLKE